MPGGTADNRSVHWEKSQIGSIDGSHDGGRASRCGNRDRMLSGCEDNRYLCFRSDRSGDVCQQDTDNGDSACDQCHSVRNHRITCNESGNLFMDFYESDHLFNGRDTDWALCRYFQI